ncbi:OmpA family protein [Fibrobacter sp.]|uniref:OmpA family protein n=1 Tax=Fibrobacter sp. TaxID=35828 RepID=UPI00388F6445
MKRVLTGLALALAVSAYADGHPQTLNKTGFVGANKTQSAQSLGHSKLAFYALMDYADGFDNMNNNFITAYDPTFGALPDMNYGAVSKFMGISGEVGLAIGIWHYFDFGAGIPIYFDQFNLPMNSGVTNPDGSISYNDDSRQTSGLGNLHLDLKARFPLPDDQPMDVAVFAGMTFATADKNKQGLWLRQPEYVRKDDGFAYAYGPASSVLKAGLAVTADFSKDGGFPFLMHLNGGYRYSLNGDYLSLPFVSAVGEFYFMDFISLFGEFYWDFMLDGVNDLYSCMVDPLSGALSCNDYKLDMKQLTGGLVIHLPIGLDLHMGGSYYIGDKDKRLVNLHVWQADTRPEGVQLFATRVNPQYTVYGGLTWSGFLLAQDRDGDGVVDKEDKCPDDFGHRLNEGCPLGNPDADEDGVCDSWVSEKGFESEFADVCEGIDECPNEAGEGEDGCPLDDPDPDKDGVCDAWVSQKKMLKKFKDVCEGVDNCPGQAGPATNMGCPEDNPDPDEDGMCSPWVTDKGKLADFANTCKGYDMCPGEPGSKANKGCPWDDPDSDGDGLCDEWVTQKKMGYYFEKAAEDQNMAKEWFIEKTCKGLDKCPAEFGPATNEGCPLGDPDTDKDGLCDEWVTQKNLLEQYEGICTGIDKCPTEPGEAWAQGCPMDNPDADGDSLCAPWVAEKGLQKDFENICHGVDKCPAENGPEWNKGCPAENPDPDGDSLCSPWVTKQKMLDQFKDVCHGYDRCEDEPGPEWNKGCPMEDDPDADKDGICSEWVSNKKLQKEFESVCTGIDRCPDIAGDDGHGCPKKAVEKLDGVTFKSGKATLESNAKMILKNVAKKLNTEEYMDLKIVIQGHTDNVGKEKTNQKLSENRAKEVMKALTKAGVKKDRIQAIGMGSSCPVDDNSTADGREMNRRIEMHFATPDNDGTKCESNFVQ